MDQNLLDLNLLVLFLSGWEEESRTEPGLKVNRAWKAYLFEVLNDLESKGMITQFGRSNPIVLTGEGIKKAKELKQKYLGI